MPSRSGPISWGAPCPASPPTSWQPSSGGAPCSSDASRPSEGLGPYYNATSCQSCHSTPASGGSSRLYRNFHLARFGDPTTRGGQVDLAAQISPILPSFGPSTPHPFATFSLNARRHPIPPTGPGGQPVQVAQRNALPLFGVGLFEFVTDATLVSLSDPEDLDGDGISGRFNRERGRMGRFGVKAQTPTIEGFVRGPLQNQMGITSNPLPAPLPPARAATGVG